MPMNLLLHDATIVTCKKEACPLCASRAADVETVIINGKIVMENRRLQTLNIERVMRTAEKAKRHLVEKLATNVK